MRAWCRALPLLLVLATAVPVEAAPPPPRPQLTAKPSGFWTSSRPARNGAYRYRMLGIGVALVLATGWMTVRVVQRHGRRTAQP
jgi:hypothetical protein